MTSLDPARGLDEPFSFQALQVVAAAREWAASIWARNEGSPVEFMDEPPAAIIGTEEERTRQALLDAVHDLEHHSRPAPRPAEPSLFEPPAS